MTESLLAAGAENTDAATTTSAAEETDAGTPATGTEAATPAPGATDTGKPAAAEGEGTEAEGKPASDETVAKGAPEEYQDFTVPEGTLDAAAVGDVKALAKELDLSQENAQKVVDVAAKLAQQSTQRIADTVKTTHEAWRAETKADKEIGGDKLAENLAKAKAAMQATSTEQLQVLLDRSGLGNHPEVIRHFLRIAPAFTEDKHVPGGTAPPNAGKSAEKVLYPNNA